MGNGGAGISNDGARSKQPGTGGLTRNVLIVASATLDSAHSRALIGLKG